MPRPPSGGGAACTHPVVVRQEQLTKHLHIAGITTVDFFVHLQGRRGRRRHPTGLSYALQDKVLTALGRWDM
jgi:hypothetical protein